MVGGSGFAGLGRDYLVAVYAARDGVAQHGRPVWRLRRSQGVHLALHTVLTILAWQTALTLCGDAVGLRLGLFRFTIIREKIIVKRNKNRNWES